MDLLRAPFRLLCLTGLLALANGCAAPEDPDTLTFWAFGQEGEAVGKLVPEFERRNPGVHVRVQQIPWSAAHEKLITAFVGETLPDVFQLGHTWLPEFMALGALAPLSPPSAAEAGEYFPASLTAAQANGLWFALPWYVETRVLFYRNDWLRRAGLTTPPATWADWLTAMRLARDPTGQTFALLIPANEWELPVALIWAMGGDVLDERSRHGRFRSAAVREALAFYLDLTRAGLAPRTGVAQMDNLAREFARGYFSVFPSGPWNLTEIRRQLGDNWGTTPLPAFAGARPGPSVAGGASLAIAARSPRAALARRWIDYLTEPQTQARLYALNGNLPARIGAWDMPGIAEESRIRAFRAQMAHLRAPPAIPEWERIAARLGHHLERAIREDASLDDVLASLDADAERILEKRRRLQDRLPSTP